ncbi:hypothetical protein Tco_1294497 [Tanacetum coccineum]
MRKAKKNTPTPFGIITDKLKALNHEMDKLRVDVRKINTNGEKKSLHEEIKSIRTSEISYEKSYPKSNTHPTNLNDIFKHYLKESCKRQYVLNEWMKKFMINIEMNLKDHDSSIKRLEEDVNHLAQLISTHNLTNQECAIKLEPPSEKPTLKDDKVPIILGRPMLATPHAKIDIFGKKISLEVGTGQITFNINERESPTAVSSKIDLLRDLESHDTMSLSPPGSARLNNDSSRMFWNNMVGFARNLHVFVGGHQFLTDFIILENINEFVEKGLTEVLFGQPFKEHVGIVEDRVKGVIWFKIGDDKTIFNMPRTEDKMGPLLKISDKDKSSGIHHPYQKIKGLYQGCLELGEEYKHDQEVIDWIKKGHAM